MNIFNNTSNEVHYNINTSSPGGDCGNIEPGATAELPSYDNSEGVSVLIRVFATNNQTLPFTLNIPQSGVGDVVTIGLYLE